MNIPMFWRWCFSALLLSASLYLLNGVAFMFWAAGSFHPPGWETTVNWAEFWLAVTTALFVGFLWLMTRNFVRSGMWGAEIVWRWLLALLALLIGLLFLYGGVMAALGYLPDSQAQSSRVKFWALSAFFGLALSFLAAFALIVRRNIRVTKAHKHNR